MIIRKIVLAGVVFSIASPLFAAEIYNKDGNQLQLTGRCMPDTILVMIYR